LRTSIGRRLNPRANQLIVLGYAVKTLESKETRASKEMTVTHNSVFAAHRLQCRMTIHKVDIRHFVFQFCRFEPVDFARDRLCRGISYCSAPICRSLKLPLITRCPRRQTYTRRPQSLATKFTILALQAPSQQNAPHFSAELILHRLMRAAS
jgi:hypothetical protein